MATLLASTQVKTFEAYAYPSTTGSLGFGHFDRRYGDSRSVGDIGSAGGSRGTKATAADLTALALFSDEELPLYAAARCGTCPSPQIDSHQVARLCAALTQLPLSSLLRLLTETFDRVGSPAAVQNQSRHESQPLNAFEQDDQDDLVFIGKLTGGHRLQGRVVKTGSLTPIFLQEDFDS